jgi:hypothetical protein
MEPSRSSCRESSSIDDIFIFIILSVMATQAPYFHHVGNFGVGSDSLG